MLSLLYLLTRPSPSKVLEVRRRVSIIVNNIKDHFPLLRSRYSEQNVNIGNETFTRNKTEIYFCDNPDINKIMYAMCHELTHMCIEDYETGHGAEFERIFTFILKRAAALNVYKTITFPFVYCGVNVHSP